MSDQRPSGPKRPRDRYSRLICLGCRERRIRCELPSEVEVPNPGELRTVQTPCYRCKRLGIPCVVRQTVLGRSSNSTPAPAAFQPATTGEVVSRIIIEFPSQTVTHTHTTTIQNHTQLADRSVISRTNSCSPTNLPPSHGDPARWDEGTLLIHTPQSTETIVIIRALDTLRCEKVEEEWFRHLPTHFGHTRALDLSIKAIVAASGFRRGVPRLTSDDCYQALALAINAVQTEIKHSHGRPNDDILASTALLAPFEGVIKRHGIPTRLHVEGLAAMLAARPPSYPVTQLAREIIDFNACESAVMACVQGTPSPLERVPRAYFANDRLGCGDGDRAQLKSLGNELFVRIPRLVGFVRALRLQSPPRSQLLLDAITLSNSLLRLQDSQAEERVLRTVGFQPSSDPNAISPLRQSTHFASVQDFEALAYYWQSQLCLLRLEWRLHDFCTSSSIQTKSTDDLSWPFWPNFGPRADKMSRLVKNILMSSEYAKALPLHKHVRLFAHAMVVVWGAMKDLPTGFGHGQNEGGTGPLSDLLLQNVNFALRAIKPGLTAEDIDTAADIFVGGPSKGRFAELFGL